MSGTTVDLIPIVIVPVVILAFWLGMMFHVNSHPEWAGQPRADTASTHELAGSVPVQRLSSPGPVVPGQRLDNPADEVTPVQAQASEAQRE
jgi:hypothetical protein